MIRYFLVLCFVFTSTLVYSQQDGDVKYSFGVRGYNYTGLPKLMNGNQGRQYISTNFNSYLFKFNDNLYSYRFNGNYNNQSIGYDNNCEGCGSFTGKLKDYAFKTGFEKNFIYGKVQPYIAFDLGYRSDELNGHIAAENVRDLDFSFRKRGFTISPGLGLKISPVKAISIFAEGNLEYFYAWGKETTAATNEGDPVSSHKFKKGEYLFNPISVGVQFHFGTRERM